MTLEQAIRDAAAKGLLGHFAIDKDPAGRGYQVSTPSRFGRGAYAVEIHEDPVAAIFAALLPYDQALPAGREMEE